MICELAILWGSYFGFWFRIWYFGLILLVATFRILDFGFILLLILLVHTLYSGFRVCDILEFILWIQISVCIFWIHTFGCHFQGVIFLIHTSVNTFGSYCIQWLASLRYFGFHFLDSDFWLNTLDSYFWLILPGFNTLDSYFG